MFIDYIPLMLINLVAGFVLLATFVYSGLDVLDVKALLLPIIQNLLTHYSESTGMVVSAICSGSTKRQVG